MKNLYETCCRNLRHYLRLRHQVAISLMNVATHERGAPLVSPMYYFLSENESYRVPNTSSVASWWSLNYKEPMNKDYQSAKFRSVRFPEENGMISSLGRSMQEMWCLIFTVIESIPVFAKRRSNCSLDGSGVKMGVDLQKWLTGMYSQELIIHSKWWKMELVVSQHYRGWKLGAIQLSRWRRNRHPSRKSTAFMFQEAKNAVVGKWKK